jgi:SnoaL-like domain
VDALEAARAWVAGWSRAWIAGDHELVGTLYTRDAVYRSHPFREPHAGAAGAADYARTAFGEEEAVRVWFGEPVASGRRAAVEYWAILRAPDGEATLAGTTVLRFAPDGRVEEHREYWSMKEGGREPPPGWGR